MSLLISDSVFALDWHWWLLVYLTLGFTVSLIRLVTAIYENYLDGTPREWVHFAVVVPVLWPLVLLVTGALWVERWWLGRGGW